MKYYATYDSIIGQLYIVTENNSITALYQRKEDFIEAEDQKFIALDQEQPLLMKAVTQLHQYFAGERQTFDLPLRAKGTSFQMKVWEALKEIPYGKTQSYQDIALAIGNEKAVRAIGQANKANQLPIFIPCHRVIGKDKTLTGYAGKRTNIKEQLLLLEGASFKK
ncbi:methylated-DNA--protein-cysteine methyltransferase, constitutive [Robertmurraya siralis]|uniref:Methylated-DNA--protein-cysteine methyltransferase n=1 Tax=Robertmurraya siralis TaxID=77777 RepID=A0A920BTI5_9BACI|nr:methylated-DNA--[protein]-cysteine S-methyltransferase [Robertmurraya siralis]PAE19014.1 cysteine methyltransferase [Bacillus sp. 7504-2]GIN61297.1 methylated-DNA--protein-cysteine methyltransferase, constitutive [Robertmurraya siralis]